MDKVDELQKQIKELEKKIEIAKLEKKIEELERQLRKEKCKCNRKWYPWFEVDPCKPYWETTSDIPQWKFTGSEYTTTCSTK